MVWTGIDETNTTFNVSDSVEKVWEDVGEGYCCVHEEAFQYSASGLTLKGRGGTSIGVTVSKGIYNFDLQWHYSISEVKEDFQPVSSYPCSSEKEKNQKTKKMISGLKQIKNGNISGIAKSGTSGNTDCTNPTEYEGKKVNYLPFEKKEGFENTLKFRNMPIPEGELILKGSKTLAGFYLYEGAPVDVRVEWKFTPAK